MVAVWLDDVRPMPEGYDIHVRTYEAAIEILKTKLVTRMSFDCDLGLDEDGQERKSGYRVANWVEEAARFGRIPRFEWAVHSQNPVDKFGTIMALMNANRFWDEGGRSGEVSFPYMLDDGPTNNP